MKSWKDINVSKQSMIDNLKILFFNNDIHNIQIYICEFIINNQVDSLLDTLIELYSYYYASTNIQTISKFNKCIDIVKNNKKHLYLNPNRTLFNHLSYDIINLNKTQNFYNRKFEVKLSIDPSIIISRLNKYNLSIFNNIKLYLPSNQHRYLLELIYFLSTNNQENFNNILNTMISKFSKDKLEKNVESINMNLNDCYILIFFELFRKYKELYNDPYINNIFDMYYNIFNFKLKKSNINSRINIIFILFHSLMNNNNNIKTNYYKTNYNPDIDNINQIYNKLIDFYELPKEIKKNIKKPSRKKSKDNDSSKDTTSNSSNNNDSNDNDIDNVDYLYTLINFNNKAYKKKLNKIDNNKKNLKNIINKPININGNEKIFSSFTENDVNIVKLNNILLY